MMMEMLGTMVVEIPGIVVATWVVTEMVEMAWNQLERS